MYAFTKPHHNQGSEQIYHMQVSLGSFLSFSSSYFQLPHSMPGQPPVCFLIQDISLYCLEFDTYVHIWGRKGISLLSLSLIILYLIHFKLASVVHTYCSTIVCMVYHKLFIQSPVHKHLGHFKFCFFK